MTPVATIKDYLRRHAGELGDRLVATFPPLHDVHDPLSPHLATLLRRPYPAQALAIMGVVRRWQAARTAAVIAECGTGKTLISLGAVHVHAAGRPFTALALVPPQIVEKWAREALHTIPGLRVFLIDSLRDSAHGREPQGVNEVRWRNGRLVREGLHTMLSDLRLRGPHRSARARWRALCPGPALFVVGRDRAKLGYFWRHAYQMARSGPHQGSVINPDTGRPVLVGEERLLAADFRKVRRSERIGRGEDDHPQERRTLHSPLWQADRHQLRRYAPVEFIGRYLHNFFDYAIADEAHQLKGDTAQGNALGTLAAVAERVAILTGTLLGGYADDVYNLLFRLEPGRLTADGHGWEDGGVRTFAEAYGVLERITTITPADNACSKARVTKQVKRRPGASPLLFGRYLMGLGAFVSLEDIAAELPPYAEEVIGVPMDAALAAAYGKLEAAVEDALREHRGNPSVVSAGLHALLLYPDHPFGLGPLTAWAYDGDTERRERLVIAEPEELDPDMLHAKERRLVEIVRGEVARGRRVQVYAVYTQKHDVAARLAALLAQAGVRTAALTTRVRPEEREAWYARELARGTQAVVCHPRLVETGLDLLAFPTLVFYETGYSVFTLRQASRRSWRIGQRAPVRVVYLHYEGTLQSSCLRLMGRKLLVSLALEGKFAGDGLGALEDGDDILTALARELVTERRIGESADQVWRELQARQPVVGVAPDLDPAPVLPLATAVDADTFFPTVPEPTLHQAAPESAPALTRGRKRQPASHPDQFLLFAAR